MIAIFRKEITLFFSSLIGYLSIGSFLVLLGLFMWVLPGNLLENGYATMDLFFAFSPQVFLLLIPAITMRSFAEEKKTGTIEILATKPITDFQIVLGKYFAGLLLLAISLLPTFLYYYSLNHLAQPQGNLDTGAIIGSYLGLFLVASAYISLGLFSSSLTDNQIVAFISGLILCFLFFTLLDVMKDISLFKDYQWVFQLFSLEFHYVSISRGILDTRDIIYFLSFTSVFLVLSTFNLERRKW